MQLSFGDAEHNGKRKRTRREVFLAEMDQVVPWKALLALIEPHYPKSGQPGRQPYRLETMLRIHFLQQWYALRGCLHNDIIVPSHHRQSSKWAAH